MANKAAALRTFNTADGHLYPRDLNAHVEAMQENLERVQALEASDGSGITVARETHTLTTTMVAAKAITVAQLPNLLIFRVTADGFGPQIYGQDFSVSSATGEVSWSGMWLDGKVYAGQKIAVEYSY